MEVKSYLLFCGVVWVIGYFSTYFAFANQPGNMIVPGWVLILMGKPKIDKDTDKLVSAAGFWFQMSSLLMALYLLVPIDSSIVLYSLDNKLVVGIGLAGIPIITMLPAKLISLRWKA